VKSIGQETNGLTVKISKHRRLSEGASSLFMKLVSGKKRVLILGGGFGVRNLHANYYALIKSISSIKQIFSS
jgi:hypothetical protein